MKTLYSDKDKKLKELKSSEKRILSIEYNPKVQLKKDLGFKTRQEEIDEKNLRELMNHKQVSQEFNNRESVVAKDIYYYGLCNNYIIKPLYEYKSELTDKAVDAILEFCKEKGLEASNEKGNFFVLAPRKYFKKENMDISNVAFNVYYKKGYNSKYPDIDDTLIEIYGSDFSYSMFAPLRKIRDIETSKEGVNTPLVLSFLLLLLTIITGLIALVNSLGIVGISIYAFIAGVLCVFIAKSFKHFDNENLILRNTNLFVKERRYKIYI